MGPAQPAGTPYFQPDPAGAYIRNSKTGMIVRRHRRDRSLSGRQRRIARKAARADLRVKIYSFGDCDYYAARSARDVQLEATSLMGIRYTQDLLAEGEQPRELSDHSLDTLIFRDEDGSRRTFREHLRVLISRGEPFPCFFASTEC